MVNVFLFEKEINEKRKDKKKDKKSENVESRKTRLTWVLSSMEGKHGGFKSRDESRLRLTLN
jgi:hypothetical protein